MVEANDSAMKQRLLAIGIDSKTVENIIKNDKVVANFEVILDIAGIKECPKKQGDLLYALTTKGKNLPKDVLPTFVAMIMNDKWVRVAQIDAGVEYFTNKIKKVGKDYKLTEADMPEFEAESGVGIVVTQE